MSEWISVNVKPEKQGAYLVKLQDGTVTGGYYDQWGDWSPCGVYATYEGCGSVAFDCGIGFYMQVPEFLK